MTYVILKAIHVITMSLFVGFLFFITYILPFVKKQFQSEEITVFSKKLVAVSRKFMIYNVAFLWCSGLAMLLLYFPFEGYLLVKFFLGSLVIISFYLAPNILKIVDKRFPAFHPLFHHALIVGMMFTVVLAVLV